MAFSSFFGVLSNWNSASKFLFENNYIYPSIIVGYVLFSTSIGPFFMRNRKPFNMRKILIAYNFLEVLMNAYATYWATSVLVKSKILICKPRDDPKFQQIIEQNMPLWIFIFFLKITELLDTMTSVAEMLCNTRICKENNKRYPIMQLTTAVDILKIFFVLRKKQNQVSFLHVFHHSFVCLFSWWFMRSASVFGGFYLVLIVVINCAVHTIMYLYYGLSAIGPYMAPYLWWKKYITIIQMAQFVVVLMFMLISILTGCLQPGLVDIIFTIFLCLILILFMNFYKKYKKS